MTHHLPEFALTRLYWWHSFDRVFCWFAWVATDPEFNDKTVYTTLGRTLGPFSKMGAFQQDETLSSKTEGELLVRCGNLQQDGGF